MIDVWLEAFLGGLAGWRVASLLVDEAGPWDVFTRIRKLAGHDEFVPPPSEPGFLYGLFSCLWCMTVWTGAAGFLVAHYVSIIPVAVLASAAVAILPAEIGGWFRGPSANDH